MCAEAAPSRYLDDDGFLARKRLLRFNFRCPLCGPLLVFFRSRLFNYEAARRGWRERAERCVGGAGGPLEVGLITARRCGPRWVGRCCRCSRVLSGMRVLVYPGVQDEVCDPFC